MTNRPSREHLMASVGLVVLNVRLDREEQRANAISAEIEAFAARGLERRRELRELAREMDNERVRRGMGARVWERRVGRSVRFAEVDEVVEFRRGDVVGGMVEAAASAAAVEAERGQDEAGVPEGEEDEEEGREGPDTPTPTHPHHHRRGGFWRWDDNGLARLSADGTTWKVAGDDASSSTNPLSAIPTITITTTTTPTSTPNTTAPPAPFDPTSFTDDTLIFSSTITRSILF